MATLPPPDVATSYMACVQQLGEEMQADLNLRVAIIQLQKQVQDLQAQLEKAQKK